MKIFKNEESDSSFVWAPLPMNSTLQNGYIWAPIDAQVMYLYKA